MTGRILVVVQLALIVLLAAVAAPVFLRGAAPAGAWAFALASVATGSWAVWANRPGNFNVRPEPRVGGRMVAHGPYRWIRHPMYSAVMLAAVAAAWAAPAAWAWAAAALLAAVLFVKAGIEERAMRVAHPGYAAYCERTRRFVPWVW